MYFNGYMLPQMAAISYVPMNSIISYVTATKFAGTPLRNGQAFDAAIELETW